METLAKDLVLEYNDDTFKYLRNQYNYEKKVDMDAAIDLFEEWLKKQNHFTKKEYPREYLERLIILHKGSAERAKIHMEKLCTLKTLLPQFFDHYDIRKSFSKCKDVFTHAFLPKLTSDHLIVYFVKRSDAKGSSDIFMNMYKMAIIMFEYIKVHDYCNGFITIIDIRDVNIIDVIKELNLNELRQIVTIAMDGFGFRVKGIHMLTSSAAIEMLTKIMRQMFSAKMGDRIYVHRTVESLCDIVSKDVLPIEYGGTAEALIKTCDKWIDNLSTKEFMEYIRMMNEARTNESLRLNDTVKKHYMDIAGTFRNLSVD